MGRVSDQARDVLLELGQVVRDVALREHSVLIVLHLSGHVGVEAGILEVKHQVLAQELQLTELSLLRIDVARVVHDLVSQLIVLVVHFLYALLDVVFVHSRHLLVDVDLLVIPAARFDQLVILLVQLIDVVEELEVLLFALDVCRDDLVDIADASGFHNCLEGLLDDLGVPHVLIE